jgi:peptide/nickel transport system permease protein
MVRFILGRITYGILVVMGVILVVFFIFHALPGDPVALLAGQRTDLATRESITHELGLDLPLWQQFKLYMKDLSPVSVHPDNPVEKSKYDYLSLFNIGEDEVVVLKKPYLRRSFQTNQRVDQLIFSNLMNTLWLALAAIIFAATIGILFGIIAAVKQHTFWDHLLVGLSVFGISVPSFVSAILMALVFGYYLRDFTGLNMTGQLWENHPLYGRQLHLENLILPALTLGIRPLAIIVQLTRSSLLEVLKQDYIRTALAKGLPFRIVLFKHALKNAINPVITAVSGWLASLMAGAFFVEYIFDWKGLGFITIKAVQSLDFPVVMGCTLTVAVIFVIINILVDVLYALIDPRVRLN